MCRLRKKIKLAATLAPLLRRVSIPVPQLPLMKPLLCSVFAIAMAALLPNAHAQDTSLWTSPDGRSLEAKFVRLEDDKVIVLKEGSEMTLPFSKLSAASINLARILAQTVAPTKPPAAINFAGMLLDPSWLPDRVGVDRKYMETLKYFSERVVEGAKRGEEKAPEIIYGNLRWLMPLDQAVASLGRVAKMTETKITNEAYPENSLIIQGLQGRFQDGNSIFNQIFLVADKKRQLISVELVGQTPRNPGWDSRYPVETREPYYGLLNIKRNASTTNVVSYQVIPIRPGVKLIKTVLQKKPSPIGKWLEDVHWYLPAPLAGRFLDIADEALK